MSLILSLSIATFLVLLLVQAAVWSVVRVRREMLGLVVIYAVVPAVLAGAAALWSGVEGLSLAAACLLYAAITSAYIQTYPTLREDIPTFRLLFAIDEAGAAGASEAELASKLHASSLYDKKIDDLLRDGLVRTRPDGSLVLAPAGRVLAHVFRTYRRWLGMSRGEG